MPRTKKNIDVFKCQIEDPDCGGRCQHIHEVLAFLSVLKDEARLRLICVLSNTKNYTAGQLAESLGLAQNLISHHLKALYSLRIVTREKIGLKVFYKISQTEINKYTNSLHGLLNLNETKNK